MKQRFVTESIARNLNPGPKAITVEDLEFTPEFDELAGKIAEAHSITLEHAERVALDLCISAWFEKHPPVIPKPKSKTQQIEEAFPGYLQACYRQMADDFGADPGLVQRVCDLLRLRVRSGRQVKLATVDDEGGERLFVFTEISRRLDTLKERVAEGQFRQEGHEFCKWLIQSGVLKDYDRDGTLRKKAEALAFDIATGGTTESSPAHQRSILEKLAAIEAKLNGN